MSRKRFITIVTFCIGMIVGYSVCILSTTLPHRNKNDKEFGYYIGVGEHNQVPWSLVAKNNNSTVYQVFFILGDGINGYLPDVNGVYVCYQGHMERVSDIDGSVINILEQIQNDPGFIYESILWEKMLGTEVGKSCFAKAKNKEKISSGSVLAE